MLERTYLGVVIGDRCGELGEVGICQKFEHLCLTGMDIRVAHEVPVGSEGSTVMGVRLI